MVPIVRWVVTWLLYTVSHLTDGRKNNVCFPAKKEAVNFRYSMKILSEEPSYVSTYFLPTSGRNETLSFQCEEDVHSYYEYLSILKKYVCTRKKLLFWIRIFHNLLALLYFLTLLESIIHYFEVQVDEYYY